MQFSVWTDCISIW